MAKMDTLTDNFNDNSLSSSKWFSYTGGSSTLSETNSRLECALPSSAGASDVAGISNQSPKDFTNSYALVKITQAVSASTNANQAMHVYPDAAGAGDAAVNSVLWFIEAGTLYARKYVSSVATNLYTVAFNSSTHKYWRIREASGVIYWDTSSDGINWTNRASNNPGLAWTSSNVDLECKCYKAETNPGTGIFDNFNITNQTITATGIASAEAFGTAQVGEDVTIYPSSIASEEAFGTPNMLYDKEIEPTGIYEGAVGTPAFSAALLSSTGYSNIAKPSTAHNPIVARTLTVGGYPIGLLLTLTYSTVTIAKDTTGYSNINKPTTVYNGEVL